MLDSLLGIYCGKSKAKRRKVKLAYDSIDYDPKTNEFTVNSVTKVDTKYIVFWSSSAKEWFCQCENTIYKPYRTYTDLKKRLYGRVKYECCHIIACKIHKIINNS